MSDTVTASAIVASLQGSGPSFILDLGSGNLLPNRVGDDANSFRVGGAAHPSSVSGFGSPVPVDFVTWQSAPMPVAAPPTVSGGLGGGESYQDAGLGVAGAIKASFDHLS